MSLCLTFGIALSAVADDGGNIDLKYRSYRSWSIQLPAEKWFPVNDGITVEHAGIKFAVEYSGNDLRVDTDGDGELDRTIKPLIDPKTKVSTTRVVLNFSSKSGEKSRYAVRLRDDANGWEWAPGGAMAGVVKTEAGPMPIRIVDQDGNGRFDDVGSDAMIVGATDHATFLSKAIIVDNKLQTVQVAEDGATLRITEYQGPLSTVDMTTSFDARAVLLSAVLLSEDRQYSFDVGSALGPIEIPAGTYHIAGGMLGLGEQRVQIGAGKMKPLQLVADKTTTFDWGGPAKSEFQFARRGGQVQFSANAIWYYGDAGEEYFNWRPIGKSPQFKIIDADTGVVLEVAILPGSC